MSNANIQFKSNTSNMEAMLEAFFCVQCNEHVKAWRNAARFANRLSDDEFVDALLKGLRK